MDAELEKLAKEHYTNAYLVGVGEVIDRINAELPLGYRATFGECTHKYNDLPEYCLPSGANVGEWIHCGFIRVHHGDPHYPVFIYREKTPTSVGVRKAARLLNISERSVKCRAARRSIGWQGIGRVWLFSAADIASLA